MALTDEIFDVISALEGKPEAGSFERVLEHLNRLEALAGWSISFSLVNAPAQAEQLRIDHLGNLYWCDRFNSWTKGLDTAYCSASPSDRVIATKISRV